MDDHYPPVYDESLSFYMENTYWKAALDDYGYRLVSTLLVGGGAILVNIILHYVLSFVKWLITKYVITEDLRFIVDLVFGGINLSITGAIAYIADKRLRLYWTRQKYGIYPPQ